MKRLRDQPRRDWDRSRKVSKQAKGETGEGTYFVKTVMMDVESKNTACKRPGYEAQNPMTKPTQKTSKYVNPEIRHMEDYKQRQSTMERW